jgi:hypothetical protein
MARSIDGAALARSLRGGARVYTASVAPLPIGAAFGLDRAMTTASSLYFYRKPNLPFFQRRESGSKLVDSDTQSRPVSNIRLDFI